MEQGAETLADTNHQSLTTNHQSTEPGDSMETVVDIDQLRERIGELETDIGSYCDYLKRHIAARRELLGVTGGYSEDSQLEARNSKLTIKQLLEIKEELDSLFRRQFRLNGEELPGPVKVEVSALRTYKSGRK